MSDELNAVLEIEAQEVDAIQQDDGKAKVKAMLPMLYTSRGKLIKSDKKERVSGKNAAELLTRINDVANGSGSILLVTPLWVVSFNPEVSLLMRAHGLIAEIMLGGYTLK